MRYLICAAASLVTVLHAGGAVAANIYDGKTNLLCTFQEIYECDSQSGCTAADPNAANGIRHLVFDFRQKLVHHEQESARQSSSISHVELVDDSLLVQGWDAGVPDVVDGAGWSMSVNRSYGTMVATISGRDVAFVGMGSCIAAAK